MECRRLLVRSGGDDLVPHEFGEHRSGPVGLAEIDRRINRVALKVERFGARGEIDREPRSLRCKLPQTRREPGGSEGREDGEIEGAVLAFAPGVDHRARYYLHRAGDLRSEEHTSELQSLMRISYAVLCLIKKNTRSIHTE